MDRGHELRSTIIRAPALRIAVPFICGLALSGSWHANLTTAWAIAVIGCVGSLVLAVMRSRFDRRWWRGAAYIIALAGLGLLWGRIHEPVDDPQHLTEARSVDHVLLHLETLNNLPVRSARFEATAWAADTGITSRPIHDRMMVTLLMDSTSPAPVPGDWIWAHARPEHIERIPDPGGFDRPAWAASKGIGYEVFVPVGEWRFVRHEASTSDLFATARTQIVGWLGESGLAPRERGLVKALLLGVRDELEDDLKLSFARSGTMHVLAVSGSHVALIFWVLTMMLAWLGKRRRSRFLRGLVVLLGLWCYSFLTGNEASVLRATIMFSAFTAADMLGERTDHLNSLFVAAMALLLFDPLMLWQLSFQLSFMAVLGIILFYKPIEHLWSPSSKVLRWAWSMACVSIAAQLATTPLTLFVFKAFPIWFLPANIVVVGLVTLGVYGGLLLLFLFKIPLLGAWVTLGMTWLLKLLGWSSAFFGSLPMAYPGVRVDGVQCLILYLLIASAASWIAFRSSAFRWSTTLLVLVLLIGWGVRARSTSGTIAFTIYDHRNGLMASLQKGRELTVIGDSSLFEEDPWAKRKIDAHERASGATATQAIPLATWYGTALTNDPSGLIGARSWVAEGLHIGIQHADDPVSLPPFEHLDAIVLDGDGYFDLEAITAHHATVVLAPTISGGKRSRIRRWCAEHGAPCFDVKKQGAFILTASPGAARSAP